MLRIGEGNEAKPPGSLSLPVLDDHHLRNWPEATEVIFQSLLVGVEVEPSNEELPFLRGHGSEFESCEDNIEEDGKPVKVMEQSWRRMRKKGVQGRK